MDALLEVDEIYAGYAAGRALFGVSLQAQAGEVVALLGRNGAGKTTTIHSIMGLISPERGRISFGGKDITHRRPYEIAHLGVSLVPAGRRIFPNLTVRENLEIGRKSGGDGEKWTVERIYEIFPRLQEREQNLGSLLSGGEQQMLAIGRALMGNPRFLLLDEPTEGLSPLLIQILADVLIRLSRSSLTILLSEQNLPFALGVSDRCYVLDKGTVKHHSTTADLKGNTEFLSSLFL